MFIPKKKQELESTLRRQFEKITASAPHIVGVSVLLVDEEEGTLSQPSDGYFLDPVIGHGQQSRVKRLVQSFKSSRKLIPGQSLEGLLWSESVDSRWDRYPHRLPRRSSSIASLTIDNGHAGRTDHYVNESVLAAAIQAADGVATPVQPRSITESTDWTEFQTDTNPFVNFREAQRDKRSSMCTIGTADMSMGTTLGSIDESVSETFVPKRSSLSSKPSYRVASPKLSPRRHSLPESLHSLSKDNVPLQITAAQDEYDVEMSMDLLRNSFDDCTRTSTGHRRDSISSRLSFVDKTLIPAYEFSPIVDIQYIINDEDQPDDKHMILLSNVGINFASSLRFSRDDMNGIVVILMNQDEEFTDDVNYKIQCAVDVISKLYHTNPLRRRSSSGRRLSILSGESLSSARTSLKRMKHKSKKGVKLWAKKCCHGGNIDVPARKGAKTLAFVFFAVFTQLSILFGLDAIISDVCLIQVGTAGSNATSYFSLTSAPSSQPRSLVWSQIIALIIGISSRFIPESICPRAIRVSIAGALTTAVMAFFGITSPSANALATRSSYGGDEISWISILLLSVQNLVAIAISTAINNISNRRQYPTMRWEDFTAFSSQQRRGRPHRQKDQKQ